MARRVSVGAGAEANGAAALDGRSSPKLRERRKGDISPEQVETFFATLADSCNVVRSAKAAGFTVNWAYRRRKHAAFRNGWATAVREGYSKLELVLLERAMKGTPKLVRTAKGNDRVMREYSTALAVALLRRHADTADAAQYEPGEDEMAEVRERILEKLRWPASPAAAGDLSLRSMACGCGIAATATMSFEPMVFGKAASTASWRSGSAARPYCAKARGQLRKLVGRRSSTKSAGQQSRRYWRRCVATD